MIHSFNLEKFKEVVGGKGLTTAKLVNEEAKTAIDDYYFRRYGLIASILVISIFALSIFLLVKRIEKKSKNNS